MPDWSNSASSRRGHTGTITLRQEHQRIHQAKYRDVLEPAVRSAHSKGAVIALYGPAGIGKSELALKFAQSQRARYPEGQIYARLQNSRGEPADSAALLSRFVAFAMPM